MTCYILSLGAANVGLTLRHDIIREAAAGAVVLTEGGSPEGGCADNPLVRVHGEARIVTNIAVRYYNQLGNILRRQKH